MCWKPTKLSIIISVSICVSFLKGGERLLHAHSCFIHEKSRLLVRTLSFYCMEFACASSDSPELRLFEVFEVVVVVC